MTTHNQPATITDNAGFQSIVQTWKFVDMWDNFNVVYDDLGQVPQRLSSFTVVRSDDPNEPYGALLQMAPPQMSGEAAPSYVGKKLLAKVRLKAA
ncbi:MAG: hypothetical protein AAFU41_20330 [Pseudomonadota bacterium]